MASERKIILEEGKVMGAGQGGLTSNEATSAMNPDDRGEDDRADGHLL